MNKRYPTFNIELITETTSYELTYDTKKTLTQRDFEEALISFSVKNSMADDSPVFSLVVLAKEKWDKKLNANDLIRIRVYPDSTKPAPDNPYIMVGLISDIHKEGEYSNGSLLYRITGQAMSKALMGFEVGVIQEVSTIIPDIGWLPDGTENGLHFSGNTAAGIATEIMERFVYKYAQYNFSNEKTLEDYFTYQFSSWQDEESLADPTPFVNYEGSLRQFLEDVAAKPFNELFFEFTKDGTCEAYMRPTPFDPENWYNLFTYRFTSDIVIEESFGKSDVEMYSVYVVQAPNLLEFNSMDLGVYPKFHPDLVKKYGYKRLDAQNRYLLSSEAVGGSSTGGGSVDEDGNVKLEPPLYDDLLIYITKQKFNDSETLRLQRNTVYSEIASAYPGMSKELINAVIDELKEGKFTRERYNDLLITSEGDSDDSKSNQEKVVASEKLEKFTQKLFNWYCENANFYSGDVRVLGNPAYRLGARILYEDFEQNTTWEFYTESVQHEFSFTNGYTTILGVTRGLPDSGAKRFSNLWGKSEDFKGGYLGEQSLEELLESAKQANIVDGEGLGTDGSWGSSAGGDAAMRALQTARTLTSKSSVYTWGGGRNGKNPFTSSPIRVDCSAFVWWCFAVNGIELKGGKSGMSTDTIKYDSRLTTIGSRGSSKKAVMAKIQQGDIVYFDTYKGDGHIGIYSGNGKFIGCQSSGGISEADMTKGYWLQVFNGHVLRFGKGNSKQITV